MRAVPSLVSTSWPVMIHPYTPSNNAFLMAELHASLYRSATRTEQGSVDMGAVLTFEKQASPLHIVILPSTRCPAFASPC